jgi:hypothetical protein
MRDCSATLVRYNFQFNHGHVGEIDGVVLGLADCVLRLSCSCPPQKVNFCQPLCGSEPYVYWLSSWLPSRFMPVPSPARCSLSGSLPVLPPKSRGLTSAGAPTRKMQQSRARSANLPRSQREVVPETLVWNTEIRLHWRLRTMHLAGRDCQGLWNTPPWHWALAPLARIHTNGSRACSA